LNARLDTIASDRGHQDARQSCIVIGVQRGNGEFRLMRARHADRPDNAHSRQVMLGQVQRRPGDMIHAVHRDQPFKDRIRHLLHAGKETEIARFI